MEKFIFLLMFAGLSLCLATDVSYDSRGIIIDGDHRVLFSGSIHYPRSTPEVILFFYFLIYIYYFLYYMYWYFLFCIYIYYFFILYVLEWYVFEFFQLKENSLEIPLFFILFFYTIRLFCTFLHVSN